MEGESQSWILMLTGRAPTNIAVIKYWGKRDEKLILPINDSISVTLDPEHLSATATVAVNPSFTSDRMWLNGKEVSLAGERYQNCLREIRSLAKDIVDEKNGIIIRKEDWQSLHLHIASHNNFPTAASFFCCWICLSSQGSGSACRSLYGGFVKWTMGKETDGSDSVAVQLANEKHWEELVVLVAVVSSRQKETSSTTGMRESVETSELIHHRSQEVVPKRIVKMEEAIANHDFASFARITCADSNQFHAVCLDTSPPIFYMNDTSHRVINSLERWNQFEGTPQVAYTFDAGPNAVLFVPNRNVAGCLLQRLLYYFPPDSSKPLSSYVIGDTSILGEIGLKSMGDVESLAAPSELQKGSRHPTFPGAVDYFICTRPGKGPVLFRNEDQALLNPKTGFPLESS